MYPKCKLRLEGNAEEEEFVTLPKNKTEDPVFEEGCMFTSKQPYTDKLIVDVIDVKGVDSLVGSVTIPIDYLITSPHQEFMNKSWSLEGGHASAKIYLSSKLYIV